jgi:hypothetical protein
MKLLMLAMGLEAIGWDIEGRLDLFLLTIIINNWINGLNN